MNTNMENTSALSKLKNISPADYSREKIKTMKIASRLYIAFGTLIVLMFILTSGAFITFNGLNGAGSELIASANESMAFQKIETYIAQGFEAETGYVGMAEEEAPQEMAEAEKNWNMALAELESYGLDEEQRANVAELKNLLSQASSTFNQSIALVQAGDMKAAQENPAAVPTGYRRPVYGKHGSGKPGQPDHAN